MADTANLLTLPKNGNKNGNGKMMKCKRRTIIVFGCLLGVVLCIYFMFFRHAPADELLAVNSKSSSDRLVSIGLPKAKLFNDGKDDLRRKQAEKWEQWAQDRVVIGSYYSNCDDDAIMMGKVTMIPDKVNGGVLSYHYFNATWENEVEDGTMFIEVKYNGQDLYSNHFDLCTVDEEVIRCPYKAGFNHIEGTIKIPAYIPTGQYTCKAWLKDQDDVVIGCGYADFLF